MKDRSDHPTAATLIDELTEWLEGEGYRLASARLGAESADLESTMTADLAFQRELWDAGFTRFGWPNDVGGLGGSAVLRAIVYEQLTRHGFRIPQAMLTVETLGPAMVTHAPTVSRRFLEPCLRGDEVWCQGFSEPEAGSDLASLRCRATPMDDDYVVSGQKVWSSFGSVAHRCTALVRTGRPGHRGLSMMLIDLESPGCDVRPIRSSTGRNEFAEIFFDDTIVPSDHVIGEVGAGWQVAMSLLQWERGMYAWQRQAHLHALMRRLEPTMSTLDAEDRRRVWEVWLQLTALRSTTARTVVRLAAGENPGPVISLDKILLSTTEQAVFDVLQDTERVAFTLGGDTPSELSRAEWFYSRMASIYGGPVDIQRTIVAEHVLGLPRGART